MTIVSAYLYREGRRVGPIDIDNPPSCSEHKSEFVWIGLYDPDEDELRRIGAYFDLHPMALEDALTPHQLPKVDAYGDQLFIVARTAHLEKHTISYGETNIFVRDRYIITVRRDSGRGHAELREHLEAAPVLLAKGVGYVLHEILDFIVDGYHPIVSSIEDRVLKMEKRAFSNFLDRGDTRRLFGLRRQLTRFQRILGPMSEVCGKLMRLDLPMLDNDVKQYFGHVLDHVKRVDHIVTTLRDSVSSVFELGFLLEQQRQGVITRQLAAWAAILAVPTAIAGIYGMNFKYMPELDLKYGYFLVLGAIGFICFILYARFKRAGWL
ncbi:MAG TPA: magnesium and cobalt transport protein CorA [Stellaceae bacterium]|nr:magnesium and cobalt transport protein CorA [Stellaceae bacterium]